MEVGSTTLSYAGGSPLSDVWLGQLDPAGSGSWDWALSVGSSCYNQEGTDDCVDSMVLLESGKVRGAAFCVVVVIQVLQLCSRSIHSQMLKF